MSAPPRLIHVKRKRGDEDAPVTYLQLEHGTKRHRSGSNWVYQRRIAGSKASESIVDTNPRPDTDVIHTAPIIQTSKPGDEFLIPKTRSKVTTTKSPATQDALPSDHGAQTTAVGKPTQQPSTTTSSPGLYTIEPRRFHMTRASMTTDLNQVLKAGISKKHRYGTAVFVERGKKRSLTKKPVEPKQLSASIENHAVGGALTDSQQPTSTGLKKPSTRRVLTKDEITANAGESAAPITEEAKADDVRAQRKPLPSFAPVEDIDKKATEMDQWVLHELGFNLQQMQIQQTRDAESPRSKPSPRFKPKAPAQRFAERHPELARRLNEQASKEAPESPTDTEMSDEDYEIEVYELTSTPTDYATSLRNIPPEQIGVLHFDTQEDLELFYGNEEEDSDDAWDDEDENAENHYTADYPEDEIASDDEYDRNPYLYHNDDGSEDDFPDVDGTYYARAMRGSDEDDDPDAYVIDAEKLDGDKLFEENIRRYIRQYGSG
ncbi:hypothetical protein SODALDRAFT_320236 [Sodiomyces alkalinus F11]|uniref:Transcription factor Iwr1 domain-containing protein n=1 Tax=Sodiomyces alkalinus (strain CBS 110278 / VKM F-3762 / F11) TaxID=1314773 RepID=A0A3N2PMQ4_SODAK|nr:hypothetical protein SODALDRAFT_320236 [Sodiomyces alkalinus F11]ROT35710.1 hypothetical protein SODALDRAFT_320236 [Sodiomyces alkalinus F11]